MTGPEPWRSRFCSTAIPATTTAIAILLALASPEVELLGVTTVAGNQTLEKTTANALRVLELAGRGDVPAAARARRPAVRRSAESPADVHGESGLDGPALPPARRLAARSAACRRPSSPQQLLASPGRRDAVPIGPLTNVALLLACHPEAAGGSERVVLMGGAIAEGNVTPAAEFNVWADPEAAARVFGAGLALTMVGLDAPTAPADRPEHAARLRAAGRVGALVADLHEFYATSTARATGCPGSRCTTRWRRRRRPAGLLRTARPQCRDRLRLRALPRPHGRRPLVGRTGRPANARVATGRSTRRAFLELLIERVGALH